MNKEDRNRRIARIKIMQSKILGLADRDNYEAFIYRLTQKRSTTEMTKDEQLLVIKEMDKLMFQENDRARKALKPMFAKLYAILKEQNLTWNYINGMAKQMFGVDRANWLSYEQLHKLVAALQTHANRKNNKEVKNGKVEVITPNNSLNARHNRH